MGGLLSRLREGVLRFFFVRPAPVAIEASNEPTQTKSVVRRKYESEEVTITSTSSGGSEPPQTDVISDEGASILKEAENALDSAEGGVAPPSDDQTVPEATGYDALPEPQQDYQPEPEPEVEHEAAPAEIPETETETETGSDDVKEDMTSPTPIQSAVFEQSSSIPIDPQCECDRSKFTDENPHLVRRVTWFGPAENVYVTGSWLNWEKKIQLTNIGHDVWQADLCFKCVDDVSVELKFVVDTMWLTSPNMLTSESSIGSTNNIIYLRGSE